ncbi:ATP-dependent DNA helicase PcrA [Gemmata obscuriglobus]|uniref:DNA 3'-5' helicase n=1 Tax=Gemmata obscuriglobus TaxID=114 RepID=A0A2Z3H3J8_9BACT|nr:UvrD-helicase domain-containing protein [Gemmata obscuriglobus]AWM39431.1 ATP-dependent DNA helicase [Gemmata obscuriglobus]QEG27489.1 ATP-dependent DNA helicase PcrA [Gemmata obscuriglobus]VTS04497.1 atp-dependent dna helicase : DNA helicase OS=Singulisphaera acidiphila (strain ATCC BAA-1392 / DSM 18658 / VKM B-2454 / MOB10) GN=Sinac_5592 PE=4 SV=1: UvrD-helicase: UvrD_C [Gemmata obscuriglobus UQM 2246]
MSDDADLLADLTPDQRAAVMHGEGPLLILAGAGSGKTRVITRRVAYLLRAGVRAHNILAITFTNKAAGEMKNRVEKLAPGNRVWVSTFHSLGARLLRQYAERLGFDRNFTIYDTDDRNKLVKDALEAAGIDNVKFTPERIAGAISKAKNQLVTPPQYERTATDFFQKTVAAVYPRYEKRLRSANAMDFDDLLYLPAMALKQNEELRAELDSRFRYIMIDEYQDTNSAQYQIVKQLSINNPNVCVVGDPDQSIYKWRGSDIKIILDFERDFPNARTITLAQNYRSTKSIIRAASVLIDHNKQRKKKDLVTDNPQGEPVNVITFDNGLDEAEGVVVRIKEAVKAGTFKYRDHAIFMRINALTRSLESAFVKHGVPFQIVKGLAFFERKENRDVLAYLRLLTNPHDGVSFLRVVNAPARGIGKVSLDKLQSFAASQEIGLLAAAGQIAKITEIKGKAATGLRDFHRLMTDLRSKMDQPPHELVRLVLDKSGYEAMLRDSTDEEDADRLANVSELVTAAKQFWDEDNSRTITDFLEQITLASDTDGWDEQADHVSVMTLHASKGLEFPAVYILAVEQGLLPHERSLANDEEIEEERRLCFVGMTRAMKELYLCHARMREFRGQLNYCIVSQFIQELPRDVRFIDPSMARNVARTAADEWRVKSSAAAKDWADTGLRPLIPPASRKPNPGLKPTIPDAPDTGLAVGVLVQHEEFGIGNVAEVSGFGALRKVRVRFAAHGVKLFVGDKIKLKVIVRKKAEE